MQTATADLLVGRLLEGRYRILDRIARGGMSTVYTAVDERLDRLVAVKVMSSALSADPKFSDRFAREARAAARLTHHNAVAVYDQGHDVSGGGHHVFLVMELVEGRTLRDLIRERAGKFTPAEAISIMEPVLAALAAAHRAGLVHRDVKPENILLSDAGVVKVADFGLARAIDSDAASTRTGLMMGTVAYCAPEQIARGFADARSDVYSAGIVLFELLTGRPPYQGETAMNVAYQHVHSRVPAPSSRVKPANSIPSEIDELVVAATDSDPAGRPADGSVFLAEIADVRSQLGLPISPIPVRVRPPTAPGDPRRNGRSAHDVTSTENLHAGAADHQTQIVHRPLPPVNRDEVPPPVVIPPPRARKQRTAKSRRRRRSLLILLIVVLIGLVSVFGGIWATHRYKQWNSHVPNLVHKSLADARAQIVAAHYEVGLVSNEFSESVPKGDVISTDPGKGARLEQGKAINLTVSLGQDLVTVPNVTRATRADAEATLQTRGLKYANSVKYQASTRVGKDRVIATSPAANESVKRDTVITLTLSSGPPILDIPTIPQGTPFDQAEKTLTGAKFKVQRQDEYSGDVAADAVVSVSPTGTAPQGSTLTVVVSKGPEFVTMPTIAAFTDFAQARNQLQALGLNVKRQVVYGKGKRNLVIGQDPDGGTQVRIGSTVTLAVV